MDGADLDALLEAKYEHDLDEELLGQLEDEEHANDETFGAFSEPVDQEFDFTASKKSSMPVVRGETPRTRPTDSQKEVWGLQPQTVPQQSPGMELSQQQQQQHFGSGRPPSGLPGSNGMTMMMGSNGIPLQELPPQMMSLQEMEAQMALMRGNSSALPRMPPMMPPQGTPHGLPLGFPQGMPMGFPQGFPQGPPPSMQGVPPQGFPQGFPHSIPPSAVIHPQQAPMMTMEQVEQMMQQAKGGIPPQGPVTGPASLVKPMASSPPVIPTKTPQEPLIQTNEDTPSLQDSSTPLVKPKKAHFEKIHRPSQHERRQLQQQQQQHQGNISEMQDLISENKRQDSAAPIQSHNQQRPRREQGQRRGPRDYQHHQHQGYTQQQQRELFGNNAGYQQRQQREDRGGYRRSHDNDRPREDRISRDDMPREQQYRGLMMQWEKEFIAKIQISQLVTERPFLEDFYYQIYTSLAKNATSTGALHQSETPVKDDLPNLRSEDQRGGNNRRTTRSSILNTATRMQRQMEKLIEKRKQKPKGTSLSLEGALGKISISTSRTPRQILSINPVAMSAESSSKREFTFSPQAVLRSIEKVYDNVLELEQLMREADDTEDLDAWHKKHEAQIVDLWKNLGLGEPVSFSLPHPFGFFLKYAKGMRVVPRALKFLSREQIFNLFNTLLSRLECVDIANTRVNDEKEEVNVFMSHVIPCLVDFVSEEVLSSINELMKTVLERHNILWMAKSRMGLALLTMFLSRAEILKQAGSQLGKDAPSENDLLFWSEIYNFLYASLQGQFSLLFSEAGTTKSQSYSGEIYIWQFLASLAVGATSVDQQRVLVTEVRSNIIATAKRESDAVSLANVNLFLNALGLGIDASQLASMAS